MPTLKAIIPQGNLSAEKARILARLKADGCIYRSGKKKTNYVIKYEVKNLKQLQQFADDIKIVYGLDVRWGTKNSGKTGKPITLVCVRSKNAYEDLMKFGPFRSSDWRIPEDILKASDKIKEEFLRAFFDDEGSVIPKREVRLYSINMTGLNDIGKLLSEMGIEFKIKGGFGAKRNVFAIKISDPMALSRFQQRIGFGIDEKCSSLSDLVTTLR